jgi:hypothetical protein
MLLWFESTANEGTGETRAVMFHANAALIPDLPAQDKTFGEQ